jgi:hypothetical protein
MTSSQFPLVTFPSHAFLVVRERVAQHVSEGIARTDDFDLVALRILTVAGLQHQLIRRIPPT